MPRFSLKPLNEYSSYFCYFYPLKHKSTGIVRNITISNIKVACNVFGEMEGNASDTISNILFKNIEATAKEPALKSKYSEIKTDNVLVNDAPLVVESIN